MICTEQFVTLLKNYSIDFFTGVPDSLLKDFTAYLAEREQDIIITANEGNAVALAAGNYMATGKIPAVFMQNSGIGNAINPLLSLVDFDVYNIPMLLMIGWRGEPYTKDEPQHRKQGKVTLELLQTIGIEYTVLPNNLNEIQQVIKNITNYMQTTKKPYALVVQKDTFEAHKKIKRIERHFFNREDAIRKVIKYIPIDYFIISTTGHISRELYEIVDSKSVHENIFYNIGAMGHTSSLAIGLAIHSNKKIVCFDGDGSLIMHLGALPVISNQSIPFKHIVFNNESHDSVGGQPTAANKIDFVALALSCGYNQAFTVSSEKDLDKILHNFFESQEKCLLEIKVSRGSRSDLSRPKENLFDRKYNFMYSLQKPVIRKISEHAIRYIEQILHIENSRKVLIFTGKNSFLKIKNIVESQLQEIYYEYYNDFSNNPKYEDIQKILSKKNSIYDIVIAIGGGSVIDMAKLFLYCSKNGIQALDKKPITNNLLKTKFIAIPTTAGTGSEETSFAAYYKNGIKYSLEDASILPDYVLVDWVISKDATEYIKACSALDALCQGIESLWSIYSTEESVFYAKESIKLCVKNIERYVNSKDNAASKALAIASNYSGRAINISKTTISHALSYGFTSEYGIPHGHAVALTIIEAIKFNAAISEETNQDKRGVEFVKSKIKELYTILETENYEQFFSNLFAKLNIETNLKKLFINSIDIVIDKINNDRLKNNPRICGIKNISYKNGQLIIR